MPDCTYNAAALPARPAATSREFSLAHSLSCAQGPELAGCGPAPSWWSEGQRRWVPHRVNESLIPAMATRRAAASRVSKCR